jgi:hypothetical protein
LRLQLVKRKQDFIDGKRVIGGYLVSVPLAIIALVLFAAVSAMAWYRKSCHQKEICMFYI